MIADLKFAARMLRKSPAFTLLMVAMLALGIGANTAMFSIFDAWLLRPLHFPRPERLTIILKSEVTNPREPKIFDGYRDWEAWARQSRSFTNLAGIFWRSFEARNGDEGVFGMIATANLLDTLGVTPERGRNFRPEDIDGPPVAVIGHDLWWSRFHGAPDILGREIELGSKTYQIIGVMPHGFGLRMINQDSDTEFYALIQKDEAGYRGDGAAPIAVIGRLKPGVGIAAAEAELAGIQRSLDQLHPDNPKGFTVLVSNLQRDNTRNVRASLSLAAAALGFILLIVCANVGSLLLGRTLQRQREIAIRAALGSGRRRIIRQLLIEGAVITALGAATGVLIAYAGIRTFAAVNPFGRMPPNAIALDWRALAFTLLASLASTLIFGLAPALEAARVDLNQAMRASTKAIAGGPGAFRLRGWLVSGQVALSMVLVVGAALLTETLLRLESQPLGFRTNGVTVASVGIPKDHWDNVRDRLLDKLRSTTGVDSAAITNFTPLGSGAENRFSIDGQPAPSEDLTPKAATQSVTPGYFQTLGIPLIGGRPFNGHDKRDSDPVVIINRNAAQHWFGTREPLGARVKLHDEKTWRTVVGVVGDTLYTFYNTLEWLTGPRIFVPSTQVPAESLSPVAREVYLVVHGRPLTVDTMRALLKAVDPDLHLGRLRSLLDLVDEVVQQPRLRTRVLAALAAMSLLLAAIGIYGVMAQSVIQRTQEIGIRTALGARPGDLVRMVVGQGVRLALVGIVIGVVGALALTRIISSLLYGVNPTDAATYIAAAFVLLGAVLLAALIPARTAARVDPMVALRQE
ncbi:MAG TPA: ABC transporter permease [Bryobacteraceae bacterium]|jgi:putative ABC transport system permease protein|nr:ABC transporter permease [Bryobacteraceae bacterium]